MRRSRTVRAISVACGLFPAVLEAQAFRIVPTVQPELRAGIVASRESMLLAGLAVNVPAGYYVRVAASVEAGAALNEGRDPAARAELVGRFMADPFRQSRWGLYGGGGLMTAWMEGTHGRPALVLVAGVEFPGASGWRRTIELAGGGGVRLSLGFKPVRRLGR